MMQRALNAFVVISFISIVLFYVAVQSPYQTAHTFWHWLSHDPVGLFTAVLAIATAILALATLSLASATSELRNLASEQAGDMKRSIAEARRSADVAERALFAANRPWIAVTIFPAEPIKFDQNGVNFTFNYIVENIGKSPATNISIIPYVHLQSTATVQFDPRMQLTEHTARLQTSEPAPFGFALFPGQKTSQQITVSATQADIENATQQIRGIYPILYGAVDYRTGFDNLPHYTGFILEIQRNNLPRPFTTERNYSPRVIWIEEGDIPVADIRTFHSVLNNGFVE